MPKKPHKFYTDRSDLQLFVNNIDDHRTGQLGHLVNIEAGSWIHGLLCLRTWAVPPDPRFALAKFKIQGKHNVLVIEREDSDSEDGEIDLHRSVKWDKKKWLKRKEKMVVQLVPSMSQLHAPDMYGMYIFVYAFSFFVSPDWCDSFKTRGGPFCKYGLKVKLKYPNTPLKFKVKRDIDIMQRRPSVEEILRPVSVDTESHSSLAGGNVTATIQVDGGCFIEGTQATFTATIQNQMDQPLMAAEVELEEFITYTVKYERDGWGDWYSKRTMERDVVENKLRGLEILPGTTKTLCFAVDIPAVVEPPTTGFHLGKHRCEVQHYLRLVVRIPWGIDARFRFPVRVVPDPARYAIIQPFQWPIEQVDPAMIQVPSGYEVTPVAMAIPVRWDYTGKTMLDFEVLSAKDLPKMDFSFTSKGGADPYVTVMIDDYHVRTTAVKKRTRKPTYNQVFRVFLSEDHTIRQNVVFWLKVFDWDRMGSDDKIGEGMFTLSTQNAEHFLTGAVIQVPLTLNHPKKGFMNSRGSVAMRIRFYGVPEVH